MMAPVGNRIRADFDRPSEAVVAKFTKFEVSVVDDAMNRTGAVNASIRPLNDHPLLGTAFTVRVPPGDNLMLHKAMDLIVPGDVVVIDAGGLLDRAICGDLMISYMVQRGVAGIVVDGAVRDRKELCRAPIPIYAAGSTPNGPYKNGPGELNHPVSVGGRVVAPGDIILGDQDGVVAVSPADADSVVRDATLITSKEDTIRSEISEQASYPRPWVDDALERIGTQLS